MKVSVVIPSYNSSRTIENCLRSILNQDRGPHEVIVVDSSDDGTEQIVADHFPTVRLIHREEQTWAGAARNIGASTATGDVLAFIDSDCVADSRWLASHLAVYESGQKIFAVAGSIGPCRDENLYGAIDRLLYSSTHMPKRRGRVWLAGAANLTVRAECLQEIGGFPNLRRGQDLAMTRRLSQKYGPIPFEPSAEVAHCGAQTESEMLEHQYETGKWWAYTRSEDDSLPGAFVLRYPFIVPLVYPARLALVVERYLRYDWRGLWQLIRHGDLAGKAYNAWWCGFRHGIQEYWQSMNK